MDYLTTKEVAQLRGVTQIGVLLSIKMGRLPAIKVRQGKRLVWRILRADAETYVIHNQGLPDGQEPPNPSGLCMCGCGEPTPLATKTGRGNYKGFPTRYIQGHNNLAKHPDKPIIDPETGCWVWQRFKNPAGYGRYKGMAAHRYFYQERYGEIPEGLDIDHLCRNTSCVNPEHLEAVSTAENVRRGLSAKLTVEDVEEMRRLRNIEGWSYAAIARHFGMSYSATRNACIGRWWKDI